MVFPSAVLGVLVHGILDIALGLRVCHMEVDGLCDAHVLGTSYARSVVVRQSIIATTIATMRRRCTHPLGWRKGSPSRYEALDHGT